MTSSKPERIPLFPLDVVLFPGTPLPLHIFEPRYKEMTRRCLDERLEFGVVLAQASEIHAVGCTAEILRVLREFPDGRMDILTAGRSVFHILEMFEEKAYLEARVEYRAEESAAGSKETAQELLRLFAKCQALLFEQARAEADAESGVPLSYQILGALPLELEFKQQMLEMESEAERRAKLVRHLHKWIPQLGHMERVRRRAGGNGHGLS